MKFEEIFKKDGLYTSGDFIDGYCLEVIDGCLIGVQYTSKDDIMPGRHRALCYRGLFNKEYRKVHTRQSLFESIK